MVVPGEPAAVPGSSHRGGGAADIITLAQQAPGLTDSELRARLLPLARWAAVTLPAH
ncbi:MAG: hypothetical protein ACRDUW_18230 [Pseudonocardiaceae bacterium]